jgi:hypothetical protein
MKKIASLTLLMTISNLVFAVEMTPFDEPYFNQLKERDYAEVSEKNIEVLNLAKTVAYQQRSYEEKINYLEIELEKTKNRLIEKSLNEEKIQSSLKLKYEEEIVYLKKELAAKSRSALEFQRQVEKINPTEDTKKLIILNNELAADLRKSEGHLAALELEFKKSMPEQNRNIKVLNEPTFNRMPASVESK